MKQVYSSAVTDPKKWIEGHTGQGFTLFDFRTKIFAEIKLNENDKFIDIGSGVGNVVPAAATYTDYK